MATLSLKSGNFLHVTHPYVKPRYVTPGPPGDSAASQEAIPHEGPAHQLAHVRRDLQTLARNSGGSSDDGSQDPAVRNRQGESPPLPPVSAVEICLWFNEKQCCFC